MNHTEFLNGDGDVIGSMGLDCSLRSGNGCFGSLESDVGDWKRVSHFKGVIRKKGYRAYNQHNSK